MSKSIKGITAQMPKNPSTGFYFTFKTSKENKANPLTRKNMSVWQRGKTKEEVRRKQL